MATTADIRKGLCIHYNNDIYRIVEFLHVKPGKGPAFVRTKLKSLTNGRVIDNTFSSGHKIKEVRVESNKFQYLYKDDSGFHFMNTQDYSQIYLQKNLVDNHDIMKEGEQVMVVMNAEEEMPLAVELSPSVVLKVERSEPGLRGNTATNATKPAILETGAKINVPLFINEGDLIKINTSDRSYIERIKRG